jgi:Cu/Ag efflux pump CusA
MAAVILGGMLTSTFLNMIVIPTLYLRYGRPVEVAEEEDEWDVGSESATV